MVKNIIVASVIFYVGIQVGLRVQTNEIRDKAMKLYCFQQKIKEQNNQMVENFSQMYAAACPHDGEFTEVDAILASMWME